MVTQEETGPGEAPSRRVAAIVDALQVMETAARIWAEPLYQTVMLPGLGGTTCGDLARAMAGTVAAVDMLLENLETIHDAVDSHAHAAPTAEARLPTAVSTLLAAYPGDSVIEPGETPGADGADIFHHPV